MTLIARDLTVSRAIAGYFQNVRVSWGVGDLHVDRQGATWNVFMCIFKLENQYCAASAIVPPIHRVDARRRTEWQSLPVQT